MQWDFIQSKISLNNGILVNGVLRSKLLYNQLVYIFWFFTTAYGVVLRFIFSVFFLYTLNNMIALFYTWVLKLFLIVSLRLIISLIPISLPS